jgi:AbrB family looped-hinge helix DNA binding protein
MPAATLTSKGQTTIPKAVREYLRLRPGDRMEFILEENGRVVLVPAVVDVRELKGILPPPRKPVTIEKMKKVIRKRGAGL